MSTTTNNYSLVKPALTDPADITATNSNWDTIDAKLKEVETETEDISPIKADLNNKVNKIGDSLTGMLTFNNTNAYHAVHKYRVVNGNTYGVNLGCGVFGGEGVVVIEARNGNTIESSQLGRLEVGSRGVYYVDSTGKRTYLTNSTLISATVES